MENSNALAIADASTISASTSPAQEKMLPSREAAELLGISRKQVKLNCDNGKYPGACKGIVNGQIGWLVPVSALTPDAQKRYGLQAFEVEPSEPLDEKVIDSEIYAHSPAWARMRADKYLAILQASEGLRGKALMDFVASWNAANPDKKTSYPCLIDARKKYASEGVSALLAKYGKRAGSTTVPDIYYEEFKKLWLVQAGPTAKGCWEDVLGFAMQTDESITAAEFPSPRAFINRMDREIPEQAQYMARYGVHAWNKKYASYIDRDNSNVAAGEVWVSDHHQLDVAVVDPDTGKARFAWLTVWRDYKSGKWLSWLLHCDDPNSDHIFYTFYAACVKYGLPKEILIDNGKDYRCKDFAGGRTRYVKRTLEESEPRQRGTLSVLGVGVRFAAPYNAQAKPIERDFSSLKGMLCDFCVGNRGDNILVRPEKLANEIKSGAILSFEEFEPLFSNFIEQSFNNRKSQGKNLLGRSPNQLWESEFVTKREISRDALALFCCRTSGTVTIGRNGITDSKFGLLYWSEKFSGMKGRKVYMRRDIKNYAEAWVFDAVSDELLGIARAGVLTAQAFAKTEVEKSELRLALAAKRKDRRIAKAYARVGAQPALAAHISRMQTATREMSGGAQEAHPKVHEMSHSGFDKIVQQKKDLDGIGAADLGGFVPPKRREEEPFFQTQTDRDIWEEEHGIKTA
jgi:hypothetical protein